MTKNYCFGNRSLFVASSPKYTAALAWATRTTLEQEPGPGTEASRSFVGCLVGKRVKKFGLSAFDFLVRHTPKNKKLK
jgi:hypothetical protein